MSVTSKRRLRGVAASEVRLDAKRMLHALGVEAELSIALIGDDEMRGLNRSYRGKDRPTDVLAFAQREGDPAIVRSELLGDVVISLDTAARQAAERGADVAEEVRTLLAHGILHLIGYDHERSPAEARRMFAEQRRLVRLLRPASPGI